MIYLYINIPQFPISLLHWSQISFTVAFFWGLQTASNCSGPDLENTMAAEAIWRAIHVVLPSLRSTCDTVHCFRERALFSFSFATVFWRFLFSNVPIMLYNIHYWWGSSFLKVIDEQNTLRFPKYGGQNYACWYLILWLLWTPFSWCCPLNDSRFNSGVTWWIDVSSIVTCLRKNSFLLHWNSCKQCSKLSTRCCFWSTVSERDTHFEHSFLIDKCLCKIVNTLPSDIFISSAISRNFNLRSSKTSLWSCWCFPGQLPNLSDLSVQYHLCLYDCV